MKALSKQTKKLHRKNGACCWYCGVSVAFSPKTRNPKRLATFDHQLPVSRGGTKRKTNLVTACFACNQEKKDMTVEEYRIALMKKHQKHYVKFHGETWAQARREAKDRSLQLQNEALNKLRECLEKGTTL